MINYEKRRISLEEEIKKRRLDSFLVTNEVNVSYLSGFKGKDSILLFTPNIRYFITDSRYLEEAEECLKGFKIELVRSYTYKTLKKLVKENSLKRMGFESMNLPYEVLNRLKRILERTKLIPIKDLIESFRSIKDEDEVELIKDSIHLAKDILSKIIKFVKPDVSEKFLSKRIELEFIKNDAHPSFEPIVASGKNSSKPHARSTNAKIEKNSFVMIDLGCNLGGYNSDLTRMVLLSKIKNKIKKIYDLVHNAQKKALDKIRPGERISEIDLAARRYIQTEGFGRYFLHSTGHGIGMEVHEYPMISKTNQDLLKPGMVFTVEPAIYIPKFGGVRLEDMVLVTNKGYEILTR